MKKSNLYLLGLVGGLGVASSDIYVSCLPDLCKMHSIHPQDMNKTLVFYFIAMALASLLYPFSLICIQRRNLFIISASLYSSACFLIALSENIEHVYLARIMQGIAFGIIQPALISVIKEKSRLQTSNNLASFSFAAEFLSIIAPLVGVIIFSIFNWKSPFICLGFLSLFLFITTKDLMKEIRPYYLYYPTFKSLKKLFTTTDFLVFNLISFLMIGLGWGIITSSSYLYDNPLYQGIFYTCYGLFYALGCLLCERDFLTRKQILNYLPYLILLVGGGISLSFYTQTIIFLTVFVLLFGGISGLVFGPVFAKAMENIEEEEINQASSFLMFSRLIGSSFFIWISSILYYSSVRCFSLLIAICFFLISFFSYSSMTKKN